MILVVGVNGVGKTTTIGKLAYRYRQEGKKVLIVAADTFRAAATEQLTKWAERVGVEIVKHQAGSDPSAVAFDGVKARRRPGSRYRHRRHRGPPAREDESDGGAEEDRPHRRTTGPGCAARGAAGHRCDDGSERARPGPRLPRGPGSHRDHPDQARWHRARGHRARHSQRGRIADPLRRSGRAPGGSLSFPPSPSSSRRCTSSGNSTTRATR